MSTAGHWERLAALPLTIERYRIEPLSAPMGPSMQRLSSVVVFVGAGHDGVGEDVTYAPANQEALQAAPASLPLAGTWTLASFAAALSTLDLFPDEPEDEVYRRYRRWAFESAALDLALRQASTSLHECLALTPAPLTFVSSLRLPTPPSLEPITARLALHANLRFKLDPTPEWDSELINSLAALDVVSTLDFKGRYHGTVVDTPPDLALYRRLLDAFPDALLEDPHATAEIEALLRAHAERVSWDVPIHEVVDLDALPFPPRTINIKPSRIGSIETLLAIYARCEADGITCYGGGQTELGPGRGQIQYLASLFHPTSANDVAPSAYNATPLPALLPGTPLAPAPSAIGFRWA